MLSPLRLFYYTYLRKAICDRRQGDIEHLFPCGSVNCFGRIWGSGIKSRTASYHVPDLMAPLSPMMPDAGILL
ncbi:MAG: hypothetical protein F6J93_02780 [Oscillatoria sp. SIO1A7]|nr:hypothetical protein [Oscillatoria sp. SIO1A7]